MEEKEKSGKIFERIVLVQLVVLGVLLCIWGYRRSIVSTAPAQDAGAATGIGSKTPPKNNPGSATLIPPPPEVSGEKSLKTPAKGKLTSNPKPPPTRRPPVKERTGNSELRLSKLHRPSILIEKSRRRLTVLDGGRVVKRYSASFGGNKGDKVRENDLRTPEGVFYVCIKNPRSKYVRSLGLSYPNMEDAERGLRDGLINQGEYDKIFYAIRKTRPPPWNTNLGGAIMIPGARRGGRDTLGCIALEDDAIRELYRFIPVGTEVTITP